MAQEQPQEEDIIIIEDSDAIEDISTPQAPVIDLEDEDEQKKKRNIILLGGSAIIVVLLVVVSILLILKYKQTKKLHQQQQQSQEITLQIEPKKDVVQPSKLEKMIAKANYLYKTGAKTKALNLYEKIAIYSQAISLYNLGVAQLKDKQYKTAFATFQKAIDNDEKRCVSAINAAVCALHLNDKENFHYYLDLAYAYLPYEVNSPLYSYYQGLIHYYNQEYLLALNTFKNRSSHYYPKKQNHLQAKIDALYGNDYDAIDSLEKVFEKEDHFSLGLLYARIGEYKLARNHFDEALQRNIQPLRSQLALALTYLKDGYVHQTAQYLKSALKFDDKNLYNYYPISVHLKDDLFDPQAAQKSYREKLSTSKDLIFAKLFYFSPYKVFNANQTISYIRKGNANIFIDNVQSAKQYLKKSSSSSDVNLGITYAIKKALGFKIRQANEELQKLVKIQPKHSILHYNLALTYAQLGDIKQANKHFIRSYYLDAKNYLSGVYAVLTSQLLHKEHTKLKALLKDSLASEDDSEEIQMYQTILAIGDNDYIGAIDWLDVNPQQRPLYLALDVIIAQKLKKYKRAQQAALKLKSMLPEDIVPNMLYVDTFFHDYSPSKYAKELHKYLKETPLHFQDLYYGPYISRYLYVEANLITGQLYYLRERLERLLQTQRTNTQEIESALALASLYDKAFEESYTLYNHLIDDLKVRDAYTLYMGAIASTAAHHHENAIALLELSKMKNKSFYESRFALALLYMEAQNYEGAAIQLQHITPEQFQSRYCTFSIDTDKLLFKKLHPNETLQ